MDKYIELLSFCNDNNNFKWKGTADELKLFIRLLINENDDDTADEEGEIFEDQKHNAVSCKWSELSLRLYHSTETLKLFGAKSAVLRERFHSLLGTFEQHVDTDTAISDDDCTSQQTPAVNCSCNCSGLNLKDELDFLKSEMILIKAQIKTPLPTEHENIKAENFELKKKLCKLEYENKTLNEECHEYKRNLDKAVEEKENLLTALNVIIKESNSLSIPNRINKSDHDDSHAPQSAKLGHDVPEKRKETRQSKKKDKAASKNPSEDEVNGPSSSGKHEADNGNEHGQNRSNTVIAGDSIISHVEGWRMSNSVNRVSVKSFSGATIDDMLHHIQPTLNHKPNEIILHIGSNNLRKDSPNDITKKNRKSVQVNPTELSQHQTCLVRNCSEA